MTLRVPQHDQANRKMSTDSSYDAIVVGSGPNGLSSAITLAQAGLSVLVLEAKDTVGGGMRSGELTLPGFTHDICSAVHPLAVGSPFLSSLPLVDHGLEWIHPRFPVAHPLQHGVLALLFRSVDTTAHLLGEDEDAYKKLFNRLVSDWDKIARGVLGPVRPTRHPIALARFGRDAIRSATSLATRAFESERAQALFAGIAAHSMLPLDNAASAAPGLILQTAGHAVGWPIPRGGAQSIADAMASYLRSLGGDIATGIQIDSLDQLPDAKAIMLDVTPHQLLRIAGDRLPSRYHRTLMGYRYGPGAFKVDFALNSPIPWKATECGQASTVHVGGTMEEIAESESAVWNGQSPEKPYVLVGQPSTFDSSRVPEGKHIAWAYCHVPNGSTFDMTERIEAQIERFAPGFRDCIIGKSVMSPLDLQAYNPNYVGGDIGGGVNDFKQILARPALRTSPYRTPAKGVYLCSASTPPGAGVHGMCGHHAARAALRDIG